MLALAGAGIAAVVLVHDVHGQDLGGLCASSPDPTLCEQLKSQAESQGGLSTSVPGQEPRGAVNGIIQGPAPTVTQTVAPPASKRPRGRSHIEELYSQRAGIQLSQFGYDLIGNGGTISALQIGAIQDDYILGQGDAIVVTLRGQDNATYTVFVDRDGNVTLPRLRPVLASGRRFGDFRADLVSATKQSYLQTQAYVTIGQVRQISVNVVGEVTNSGVYALTGLSTVLDALNVAGGIRKSGSLRRVTIVRSGHEITIDLYHFMSPDAKSPDVTLRQGDKIYVAPLGATIAVSGDVRRPGIYELSPGVRSITAPAALVLGNGYAIRGVYRLTAIRTLADGKLQFDDVTAQRGASLRDGEILLVNASENFTMGKVTLQGNVRLPGTYALNQARTLRDLLPSTDAFLPMTYMPFAFIVRANRATLLKDVIPFSVQTLIDGKFDLPLQSLDEVHILDFASMRALVGLRTQVLAPSQKLYDRNGNPVVLSGMMPADNVGAGALATVKLYDENGSPITVPGQALQVQPGVTSPGTSMPTAAPGTAATSSGEATAKVLLQTLTGQAGSEAGATGANPAAPEGAAAGQEAQGAAPGAVGQEGTTAVAGTSSGIAGLSADESATLGFVVSDYRVTLQGAVRQPGDYLAAPQTTLAEVVQAANGLRPDANLSAIEITSQEINNIDGRAVSTRKDYALTPLTLTSVDLHRLDVVRIPTVITDEEDGDVTFAGEVNFPGTYHVLKGERLSSVLARAGGLTRDAYPLGAVFERPAVALVQQKAHQREADDLQKQLMATVARAGDPLQSSTSQSGGLSAEGAGFVAGVIAQLRSKPVDGRMSIVADPAALAASPQADIELRPGDKLFIPKRPSEVDVTGEVLNPGSFRFSPKLDASDYIDLSGGYDRYADEDHIFVVNPDGTSRRLSDDLFDFAPTKLAPGSVIVVPRDLTPLDLGVLTVTVSKVLSDLAISAAALAVVGRGNN